MPGKFIHYHEFVLRRYEIRRSFREAKHAVLNTGLHSRLSVAELCQTIRHQIDILSGGSDSESSSSERKVFEEYFASFDEPDELITILYTTSPRDWIVDHDYFLVLVDDIERRLSNLFYVNR